MSEEQFNQNENKENKCKVTMAIVISVLALLLSISSLVLSLINLNGGSIGGGENNKPASADKNAISKKYDKGKSLAKALKTGKPVIVFFYTDWCSFCQRFAPTYDAISKDVRIKKDFAIAYVNCEDENNRAYMQEYGIEGFPTVYVVNTDGTKKQLENNTFFIDNAKDTVIENAFKAIGK